MAFAAAVELPSRFEEMSVDERRLAVHEKLVRAVRERRRDRKGLNYGHRTKAIRLIYAEAEASKDLLHHPLQMPEARMVELACQVWPRLRSLMPFDELPAHFNLMSKDERRAAVHDKLISAVKERRSDKKGLNYGHRSNAIEKIYQVAADDGMIHPLQMPKARMVELACQVCDGLRSRLQRGARPAAVVAAAPAAGAAAATAAPAAVAPAAAATALAAAAAAAAAAVVAPRRLSRVRRVHVTRNVRRDDDAQLFNRRQHTEAADDDDEDPWRTMFEEGYNR
jgi:hypothetical protein